MKPRLAFPEPAVGFPRTYGSLPSWCWRRRKTRGSSWFRDGFEGLLLPLMSLSIAKAFNGLMLLGGPSWQPQIAAILLPKSVPVDRTIVPETSLQAPRRYWLTVRYGSFDHCRRRWARWVTAQQFGRKLASIARRYPRPSTTISRPLRQHSVRSSCRCVGGGGGGGEWGRLDRVSYDVESHSESCSRSNGPPCPA